jgi:hypothetical protein
MAPKVQLELVNVEVALEDPNYDLFIKFISSTTLPSHSVLMYQKVRMLSIFEQNIIRECVFIDFC